MCHMSGVTCQMSGVRCQVSGVRCHIIKKKVDKVVELVGGGSVIMVYIIPRVYR